MEREKMIEEMEEKKREDTIEELQRILYWAKCENDYEYAKRIYDEENVRIIPEGAVVLTKEQQEEIDKGIHATYLAGRKDGSKEEAKRIYEKAKKKKYVDNDDEGCYWGAIALDDLADICGVEVE